MKNCSKLLTSALLNALRSDASKKISRIAAEIKRPVTTVFEEERRLRRHGVITRYYSSVDFEKTGFTIRACFFLGAGEELQKTAESLMRNRHSNNVQVLKGSGLFVEAMFGRIEHFLGFIKELPAERSIYYVIDEIATESAVLPKDLPVIL